MANHLILDAEYPELLADIAREIHARLMDHKLLQLAHPIAAEIALSVTEHVRKNIGGVMTYVPRGQSYELSLRDRQMYAEFTGDNYGQLAQKNNMSEMRVRQIMAHVGRVERAKRQADMFAET